MNQVESQKGLPNSYNLKEKWKYVNSVKVTSEMKQEHSKKQSNAYSNHQ